MDVNIPISSDGNDSYEIHKKPQKFIYALNANIQNEDGNSSIIQNEHSNLLCSMFKPDYEVLHHQVDRVNDCVYFWLKNPITGCSEIGRICQQAEYNIEDIEKNCNCNALEVLNNPLEDTEQSPLCTYETIITDCCGDVNSLCLNFDKKHRISSEIKVEDGGIYLYWVDGNSPDRRVNILNPEEFRYKKDPCDVAPSIDKCLICDELNIDKNYSKPCLKAKALQIGGNTKEGAYMFAVAYSDIGGAKITRFMSHTNWVKVKDPDKKIYQPSELDRNSGYAIRLELTDLDLRFDFYKIFVVAKAEVDGKIGYFEVGVFPTTTNTVIFSGYDNLERITIDEITSIPKRYKSKFIKQTNDFLLRGGLKSQIEVNLQPVFSLAGQFVKFRDVMANEDLYANGVFCSLYESHMRDEVIPLSIRIWTNDGYVSTNFPFIARAPRDFSLDAAPPVLEIDVIDQDDSNYKYVSANEYTQNCHETPRNKWWQFYNTASETVDFEDWKEDNDCISQSLDYEIEQVTLTRKIRKEMPTDVNGVVIPFPAKDVILKDGISIKSGGGFTTLEEFWKENGALILSGVLNDDMGFDILRINDSLSTFYIIPPTNPEINSIFTGSCSSPITNLGSKIVITNNGTIDPNGYDKTFKAKTLYSIPNYDGYCLNYKKETNQDLLKYECDANASELLVPLANIIPGCCINSQPFNLVNFYKSAGIVFKRNNNYKKTCSSAQTIPINSDTIDIWTSIAIPFDIKASGAINSDYQDSSYDSLSFAITPAEYFTDKLHTNAVWFKVKNPKANNGLTFISSKFGGCQSPKDLLYYSSFVRISIYDDCNGNVGNFVYGAIYNINTGHIFQLDYKTSNPTPSIPMLYPANNDIQYKALQKKNYHIAFDTPIIDYNIIIPAGTCLSPPFTPQIIGGVQSNPDLLGDYDCTDGIIINSKILSGTCGCFNFKALETDVLEEKFVLQNYEAGIEYTYSKQCEVKKYAEIKCDPILNKQYEPAYWESIRTYPCNSELWDSSRLKIKPSDIDIEYRAEFVKTFTQGGLGNLDINGNYILDSNKTNFQNKPIRHFKAPDNKISPHQDGEGKYFGAKNIIYPLGLWIDNDIINNMLDIAVSNDLITQEFRDSVVGYEIYRGDRRMNKSIIAKGIAFDMLTYKDNDREWQTQNYPFNDLHEDRLHDGGATNKVVPHKGSLGEYGNQVTFLSPDTFFNRPAITGATELKLEAFLAGETKGNFADVEEYPKMVILSSNAFGLANTLATVEVVLETFMRTLDLAAQDSEAYRVDAGFVVSVNPVGIGFHVTRLITGVAELLITLPDRIGKAASEWVQIFYTNGTPQNYAALFAGEARYENHLSLNVLAGETLRPIAHAHYLLGENYEVNGVGFQDIKINNSQRDKVLYLNLGKYKDGVNPVEDIFLNYTNIAADSTGAQFDYDDSRYSASDVNKCDGIIARGISGRNALSPYISIKNYVPDQYGDIDDIHWMNTGYCGNLLSTNKCDVIFGGDVYISRYSHKRKFKFFDSDIWNAPSLTPFNHSEYYNLVKPRFFVDYNKTRMDGLINPYPTIRSEYRFDCDATDGFYIDGRSKFYLYYFGFVHFLVESEINCNFRYGQNEKELNIYENCGDVVKWVQPKNVPFSADNFSGGYRSDVFSIDRQIEDSTILSQKYDKAKWSAFGNYDDRVIRSEQDNQKKGLGDPYTVYKPLNYKDFGKQYGNFYGMEALSDMRVMFRFENGFVILNSNSILQGSINDYEVGQGDIFKNKATIAFQSDLGYGGTQHKAILNTPFGTFWTDAKRGNVHFLPNGGSGHEEISSADTYNWFKENLPFQILKDFPNIPDSILDNTLLGLGISMGYDARYQRIFVTKRDSRVRAQYKNSITYNEEINEFVYTSGGEAPTSTIVYPNNSTYFDDFSWTRAYSPPTKTWLSFYSFKPEFYIDHYTYFQTGFKSGGLWSHLLTNKSYQVYYGERYPFKLITALEEKYINRLLQHYDYWLDVRRYHDEIDYASLPDRNMDYACVYNRDSNTGKLVLVNRLENNFFQDFEYPKFNTDNVEILSSWTENKWSINNLYDLIKTKSSNVPIWLNTKAQDDKDLNPLVFDYTKRQHNYMKGDIFNFLLVQEKESRLKYIVRVILSNNKTYN